MPETPETLISAIRSKEVLVGVIGMGYVGLPLCAAFARKGLKVLGFDIDRAKVKRLQEGDSYVGTVPSEELSKLVAGGSFRASGDLSRLREPDVIIICVPTPLDSSGRPNLSYVEDTARAIAAALRPVQLVVLESTTYPGTTEEVLLPLLESGGHKEGRDFLLAYSPEREDPGRSGHSVGDVPKVVGAVTERGLEAACALYKHVAASVVPVSSTGAAEATKMLENTYRAVNIALVNEMKLILDRMNVDIWEVVAAAKTKPFGFHAFTPGPGWGGHCIPIDPLYLAWKASRVGIDAKFIELAASVNRRMPEFVVGKTEQGLAKHGKNISGSKILILGVAYKPGVNDDRESPAYEVMELLAERGAVLSYNDPYIPVLKHTRRHSFKLASVPLNEESLQAADCVVVVTDHSQYDADFIVRHAQLIVDTRNLTGAIRTAEKAGKVVKA